MSRQIGSLHRSNSHPANLQTQFPIIPLFAFPPTDLPVINVPSSTNSDTNSDISIFHTISQFNNSDVKTPDDFADNFITLQQQLTYPHTHTVHQLSSTVTSSNPPTPTRLSDYTPSLAQSSTSTETSTSTNRAYRTSKRKFPNHPFPSKPGTAREYINHPDHKNTPKYLQVTLPLFPQYTLNSSNTKPEPQNFVDGHVLIPTLHWTAYYNYTKPLSLPLHNTTLDIERKENEMYSLTTSLTPRHFTYVG